jgi:hypothetical protein
MRKEFGQEYIDLEKQTGRLFPSLKRANANIKFEEEER